MSTVRKQYAEISQRMQKAGFVTEPKGMCYGWAGVGMQELLAGNIDELIEFIRFIKNYPY